MIEDAWAAGFDIQGRDQLNGKLSGTSKWIGATEIASFLSKNKIKSRIFDFHKPTSANGRFHPKMLDFAGEYFRTRGKSVGNELRVVPPLYLQHDGHSRTIVGVERLKSSGEIKLLIFDPLHQKMNLLKGGGGNLASLRNGLEAFKHKQYQIVAVTGLYGDEAEASKVLTSVRIP